MSLWAKVCQGDFTAVAKLISTIEDNLKEAIPDLKNVYAKAGNAYIVGFTGAPGSGKSTLVSKVAREYRKRNKTIGIIAVDPSSHLSGGALLGDRIRMKELFRDDGIFIRSMASRGESGGLAKATSAAISVLDAMGKDVILVETVGIGQSEIDITKMAHSIIVVLNPGMGDEIQNMKAGILEIGDIFVVNKFDKEGAEQYFGRLENVLLAKEFSNDWKPRVFKTIATEELGIVELVTSLEERTKYLSKSNRLAEYQQRKCRFEIADMLKDEIDAKVLEVVMKSERVNELIQQVTERKLDPYSAVEAVSQKVQIMLKDDSL